jgi:hypothetical protein
LCLAATVVACFGAQTALLHWTGGRTTKSESNYFSSLARLQSGSRGEPRVMLLGSSITGRLPDRNRGFEGVANLGCDGGSAVEVLRAMDAGTIPRPPAMIVEGNTLYRAVGAKETELAAAMRQRSFRTGVKIPNLGAGGRPSAVAYTLLMERKMGRVDPAATAALPVSSQPASMVEVEAKEFSKEEDALLEELKGILQRLTAAGSKVSIVVLPPGGEASSTQRTLPAELARRSGVPFWDLAPAIDKNAVRYTDGVHMDPPSAAAALRTMLDATGYQVK